MATGGSEYIQEKGATSESPLEVKEHVVAGVGSVVEIEFHDTSQHSIFTLIDGPIRANNDELSIQSPVGEAALGKSVGDKCDVFAGNGQLSYSFTILSIRPAPSEQLSAISQ